MKPRHILSLVISKFNNEKPKLKFVFARYNVKNDLNKINLLIKKFMRELFFKLYKYIFEC